MAGERVKIEGGDNSSAPCVTVLTPVYNVEAYLPQCLGSLAAQTLESIEFVVVNDGSTDGSLSIIEQYAAADARFRVIDRENGGYGSAMNAGLDAARGEYIGILESDDFAEPELFEKLYAAASANSCDLAKCNYWNHDSEVGSYKRENYRKCQCGTLFDPADPAWRSIIYATPAIWTGLYRRTFLEKEGIRFLETPGAAFQDTGFVFKTWAAAKRVFIIHDYLVHYRIDRADSSVRGDDKVYEVCGEWDSIMEFLERRPQRKEALGTFYQAQRYVGYRWNYKRIAPECRLEFLKRVGRDYRAALDAGELDKRRFAPAVWRRLMHTIDDPAAVVAEDERAASTAAAPKVSAIVPVYNAGSYLEELLASLHGQTLREVEFLLVDDGSTDSSAAVLDRFCAGKPRFRVFHKENGGVGSARNMGLAFARGDYVVFADADDLVPEDAYECLYRSVELAGADMAIGVMEEFSLLETAVYPQTRRFSKMREIKPYERDHMFSLTLCNKILRRSLIEENGLRFADFSIGEDALFFSRFIGLAKKTVGCPHLVYRYRKLLWFEGKTATGSGDAGHVISHVVSHRDVGSLFQEGIGKYADARHAAGDEVGAGLARAACVPFEETVYERLYGLFCDRYYRHIWMMDDAALTYLQECLPEFEEHLSASRLASLRSYLADLRPEGGLMGKEELAARPLVSVCLADGLDDETLALHLDALYAQNFPAFELLVGAAAFEKLPKEYAGMPNIRILDEGACTVRAFAENARAPYLNFLDARICHGPKSLKAMYEAMLCAREDFAAFGMAAVDEKGKRYLGAPSAAAFRAPLCRETTARAKINAADFSLCNKVFKKAALLRLDDMGLSELAATCYRDLSFLKRRNFCMVCFEPQDRFLARLPRLEAAKLVRLGNEGYARWWENWQKEKRFLTRAWRKATRALPRKKTVLFFTQRNGGGLSANLQLVYDALDGVEKVVRCKALPHPTAYKDEVKEALKRASVVVTDDYCPYLAKVPEKPGRVVVQLWHACGAFKKFGLDYAGASIAHERSLHRRYSLVSVSSEAVRPVYAKAFGISQDKVRALGVPRTDLLLDTDYLARGRARFSAAHGIAQDKKVVLYAPTFRQKGGKQVVWDARVDWAALSEALAPDVVLVVKRHPLETTMLVCGEYPNIVELAGEGDVDALPAADLLVTDYSSIVFDFALMGKPFVFYCPDIAEYETSFYLKFPQDFGAGLCTDPGELASLIERGLSGAFAEESQRFKERYMGACDGHSTERIAAYIRNALA